MTRSLDSVPGKTQRLRLYACIYGLAVLTFYTIGIARVGSRGFPIGGPGDFRIFITAGEIIATGEASRLYDLGLQSETQRSLLGTYGLDDQRGFLPYMHPPFFALVFVPLAYLPLPWAFYIWNGLNVGLLLASIWLLWRHKGANSFGSYLLVSLLALSFLPVLSALYNGQSSFVLLFAMTLFLIALKSRRDWLAGAALALGLVKPQLILLVLVVLLYRRAWRTLMAFAAASVGLLLVSTVVVGGEGLRSYVAVLRGGTEGVCTSGMYPTLMSNVRGTACRVGELLHTWLAISASTTLLQAISILLTMGVVLFTLHAWRAFGGRPSSRFGLLVVLTLAGTLLVSPHLYLHDLTLLIAGALVLVWEASRCDRPTWHLPMVGAGHVVLFLGLLLLPGPVRAQLAALLLVTLMVASYIELRRAKDDHAATASRLANAPRRPQIG